MLKWLRKYQMYILVVGGCLLMVAFLLGSVLQDLGRHGLLGGTAFKVGSRNVGVEEFRKSSFEYAALCHVIESTQMFRGRPVMQGLRAGEDEYHWYLLTSEAKAAGLVGGRRDGEEQLDLLCSALSRELARSAQDLELIRSTLKSRMLDGIPQAAGLVHFSEDEIYQALAKMRGAQRLQNAYLSSSHYGNTRLITDARSLADSVGIDYVLYPAERETASIPEPDEAAIKAHFEKFKDTPKGGGDFGIGYKLPARFKVEWLELNRAAVSEVVNVDQIEVEKRFQSAYPNSVMPDGKTVAGERKRLEDEVRGEIADKVMRSAEAEVRAQIDRVLRKLDRDGEYYRLPADWSTTRPDYQNIREAVAKSLLATYKIMVPAPKVMVRSSAWIEEKEARTLDGIGGAYIRRSNGAKLFSEVAFAARELGNDSDIALQVGVPAAETLESAAKNKYFFTILDARKESPPDSIDEVRADVVKNIKRLAAYDKLKAMLSDLRIRVFAGGLEGLAKARDGTTDTTLPIQPGTVRRKSATTEIDAPAIRDRVVAVAAGLDPLVDPAKLPEEKKADVVPLDKALAICAFRIKKISPLTAEMYRTQQSGLLDMVRRDELSTGDDLDPFSLEAMEERLNVQYEQGRGSKKAEKADKAKSAS